MKMSNNHYDAPQRSLNDDRAPREFLTERALAERWSKSTRTIQRMRASRSGPAFFRIGGSILYRLDDIETFEAAMRVEGTV